MDLNDMAGTLPFFEPAINWEDSEPPPHHQTMLPPPPHHTHNRHLHTFVPMPSIPSSSSTPMVSYGGLPPPIWNGDALQLLGHVGGVNFFALNRDLGPDEVQCGRRIAQLLRRGQGNHAVGLHLKYELASFELRCPRLQCQ